MTNPERLNTVEIARRLISICLFNHGPQDLPASWNLLLTAIAADIAISYPATVAYTGASQAGTQVIISTILVALLLYGTLYAWGYGQRFVQTATAVFGTDLLITLLALPIALTAAPGERTALVLGDVAILMLSLWTIGVLGHILRYALSVTFGIGVVLAVGFTVGTVYITRTIAG